MSANCTGPNSTDLASCRHGGERAQVFIGLLFVIVLYVVLFLVHIRWRRNEFLCAKAVGVLNEASGFAANLVKHFSPSMKVAKYQFRGMQAPKATVDIAFKDLGLRLHSGAKVLNSVTGEFKAGRMCAIMGPSGAGKTTFMNVLCGKATYGVMDGKVLINGYNIDIHDISSVVGFVPQDDIVHETLTVREQIRFSAMLRNKVRTSPSKIESITDDVLNVMQIDHVQNTIVGGVEQRGISGGQRKRVNIGLELASQPTVLFLDEPTSGLDSTSSLSVVVSLKKMTQLGMSCIMVIHQPRYSLFTLFDDVLLLGKGGNAVYLGGSLGAKDYFESLGFRVPDGENVADWFMDVISGEVPNPTIQNFQAKMLFDMWDDHERTQNLAQDTLGGLSGEHIRPSLRGGRSLLAMTEQEDVAVLSQNLTEEWDRIDINHDGYLDTDELKSLLQKCSNLEPSDEVVDQLMARMAGPSQGVVQKQEFLKYLISLKHDVAQDAEDQAARDRTGDGSMFDFGQTIRGIPLAMAQLMNMGRSLTGDDDLSMSESEDSESDSDLGEARALSGKASIVHQLHRSLPGVIQQFRICHTRAVIQWWRKNPSRMIFFAAMTAGALVLAGQDAIVHSPLWDAMCYVNTHTAVALLVAIYCLQIYGENQPVFWRERNRGLNVFAHVAAGGLQNNVDVLMQCFLFTAVYYAIRGFQVSFFIYWIPYLLVVFASSGWGYAISAWVPYTHGPFIASLVIFVVCGLLGNPFNLAKFLTNPFLEVVVSLLSITRWSIPMSFYMYVNRTHPVPAPGKEEAIYKQYEEALDKGTWQRALGGSWIAGICMMLAQGVVLRLVAYFGLKYRNRDKQV